MQHLRTFLLLVAFLMMGGGQVWADDWKFDGQIHPSSIRLGADPHRTLKVGISQIAPCVSYTQSGKPIGFSIDLWERVAEETGWKYEYANTTFTKKMNLVQKGEIDLAIGCVSVNYKREKLVDFSASTMNSGLITVSRKAHWFWEAITPKSFAFGLNLLLLMYGSALLISLLDRWSLTKNKSPKPSVSPAKTRHNELLAQLDLPPIEAPEPQSQKPISIGDAVRILKDSFLGRGKYREEPRSFWGLFVFEVVTPLGFVMMIFLVIGVHSDMMAPKAHIEINSASDLLEHRVATKAGTIAHTYLEERGLIPVTTPTVDEAYQLLLKGEVDLVVYDKPSVFRFVALHKEEVMVVGPTLLPHDYAFAFPSGSYLIERVNLELLRLKEDGEDGEYGRIYRKWFKTIWPR